MAFRHRGKTRRFLLADARGPRPVWADAFSFGRLPGTPGGEALGQTAGGSLADDDAAQMAERAAKLPRGLDEAGAADLFSFGVAGHVWKILSARRI